MEQGSKTALEWFEQAKQKGHEWAQLAIGNISGDLLIKYASMSESLTWSFDWWKTPEGGEFWDKVHDAVWTVEQEHPFK
jgi:hypothetical protein